MPTSRKSGSKSKSRKIIQKEEIKFIRDPVHNLIRIEDRFILDLIDTPEFQRLRRITQLGLASLVYPGSTHTRFSHSIGVYHLAKRVINHLSTIEKKRKIDDYIKKIVISTALLHDIGHGPYSHLFERAMKNVLEKNYMDHEEWTKRIIRESKKVRNILKRESEKLPEDICEVIDGTYISHFVNTIISSQLDVDRFDYLMRDSLMTGAKYGEFDIEWIIRTMALGVPKNKKNGGKIETVVIDGRRGLSALQLHLIGRLYMYKHVYYHKTIRAAENMLGKILERMFILIRDKKLVLEHTFFKKILREEKLSVEDYIKIDDIILWALIEESIYKSNDKILKDLSRRLLNREIFKVIKIDPKWKFTEKMVKYEKLKDLVESEYGEEFVDYYLLCDDASNIAYKDYMYSLEKDEPSQEIYFFRKNRNDIHMISESSESVIIEGKKALEFKEDRWYIPHEIKSEANRIIGEK